jgi:hypothetical protein
MKIERYLANVKHDKGTIKISVWATSEESAKLMIMNAENCPACAIQELGVYYA